MVPEQIQVRTFRVEEMDCADCAVGLEHAMRRVPGVQQAKVYFGSSTVRVWSSPDVSDTVLYEAAKQAGFRLKLATKHTHDGASRRRVV